MTPEFWMAGLTFAIGLVWGVGMGAVLARKYWT